MTSICELVHHTGHHVGVACVDVPMADIFGDMAYYQHGEFAYSFVIDGTGGLNVFLYRSTVKKTFLVLC